MREPTSVNRRPALLLLAVGAVLAFVIVWMLGVRTEWGQTLDATALSGRDALRPRAVLAASDLLDTISVASLALVGAIIVLVGLVRRRPLLSIGAGIVIAGSVLTTEVLKKAVLERPYLGVDDPLGRVASYPSGHTTVAFSLALAAMLVAPSRYRTAVGLLGALYAVGIGVGVVATANHRPSDPIGAAFVVLGWSAVVAAAMPEAPAMTRTGRRQRGFGSPLLALLGIGLLGLAFVGLAGTAVAIRRDQLGTVEIDEAFAAACAAVTGTILFVTASLLVCLRGVSLDPPFDELVAAPSRA